MGRVRPWVLASVAAPPPSRVIIGFFFQLPRGVGRKISLLGGRNRVSWTPQHPTKAGEIATDEIQAAEASSHAGSISRESSEEDEMEDEEVMVVEQPPQPQQKEAEEQDMSDPEQPVYTQTTDQHMWFEDGAAELQH